MIAWQRTESLRAVGVALSLLGSASCTRGAREITIASSACIVDASGVEFTLPQPLKRRFNSDSIRMSLAEAWNTEPPYMAIRLADGRLAKVSVSLQAEDGRTFSAAILGAGGGLNARFDPEIPKDALIRAVKISSTVPLHCLRVTWFDFDAE